MKIFRSYSEVSACVGQEVAVTDWITITQEQVNLFAEATGDHQWIHVDPERAKAGPFGAPIAHGFLTLSMIPKFFEVGLTIEGARMGVNYGLNKVRFTAPVPVGSRWRATLAHLRRRTTPWAAAPLPPSLEWLRHSGRGTPPAHASEAPLRSVGGPCAAVAGLDRACSTDCALVRRSCF